MSATVLNTPTKSTASGIGSQAKQEEVLVGELANLYASSPSPGAVIREGARPLRVMVVAPEESVYQRFSARDMGDAFDSIGVESTTCIISPLESWRVELLELVRKIRPDAIFVFSKRRKNLPELPKELALLIWDQDFISGFDGGRDWEFGPRDRFWTLMEEWGERAIGKGAARRTVGHLNMGANTDLYQPPNKVVPFEHEVLFIGNIHPFDDYRKMIQLEAWPEAAQAIMLNARERLFEWMRTRGEKERHVIPEMDSFLLESARILEMNVATETPAWAFMVVYFRYRIAHYVVRECVIESLLEFRLGLYGQGWDRFPKFAHVAKPAIENGPEMLDVMHRSAVHVQLHTWTVHHPRLYDTAAAGGYLLVGRVPEQRPLDLEFEVGQELESFGSITELRSKIRLALDDPEMIRKTGERAAARVRCDHTMVHCARQVIEELRNDPA